MIEFVKFMFEDWVSATIFCLFVLFFFVFIPLMIWLAVEDEREWEDFSKEHNCVNVGSKTEVTYMTIYDQNLHTTTVTPIFSRRIKYRCDDGKEYWR